jgi:hypothetical protein
VDDREREVEDFAMRLNIHTENWRVNFRGDHLMPVSRRWENRTDGDKDFFRSIAKFSIAEFAAVRREEREACAKVCDDMSGWRDWAALKHPSFPGAPCEAGAAADYLAAAIRAMNQGGSK